MPKENDQTAELDGTDQGEGNVSIDPLTGPQLFDIPEEYLDEAEKKGGAAPPGAATDSATADTQGGKPGQQPRDDTGRFAPRREGEPPAAGQTGQPPAKTVATQGKPAAEGGEGAREEERPAVPFSFTADQKRHEIPGSRVTPEGAFIPRDQLPFVQRKLSRGTVYETSFRQLISDRDTEIHSLKQQLETDEDKVKAKAFLTHFAKLLDEGPEAIQKWLDDFDRNRVQLEANATLAQARAITDAKGKKPAETRLPGLDDDHTAGGEEPDLLADVDQDELQDTLENLLEENMLGFAKELGLNTLTQADLQLLHKRLSDPEEIGRFFVYATEDIPELKAKQGDILVKAKALQKELQTYADLVGQGRGVVSEADKARQQNTRTGANRTNAAPPTSSTSGGAAGKTVVPKLPKTREQKEEWDKLSDELQDASIKQGVYAERGEKLIPA
jgi:hypothetical protein